MTTGQDRDFPTLVKDAVAARDIHGLQPPLIHSGSDPNQLAAQLDRWLTETGMHGAHDRRAAVHGLADWCPPWCITDHDQLHLLVTDRDGHTHHATPVTTDHFTVQPYRAVWLQDGQLCTSDHVRVESSDGTELHLPADQLPELLQALQRTGIPTETPNDPA